MSSNIVLINLIVIVCRSFLLANLRTYEAKITHGSAYFRSDPYFDDEDLLAEGSGCDETKYYKSEAGRTTYSWYCNAKPFVFSYGLVTLAMCIIGIISLWINKEWSNKAVFTFNQVVSLIQVNIGIVEVFLFGLLYYIGVTEIYAWMKNISNNESPIQFYDGFLILLSAAMQIFNSIYHIVILCRTKETQQKQILDDYIKLVNEAEQI